MPPSLSIARLEEAGSPLGHSSGCSAKRPASRAHRDRALLVLTTFAALGLAATLGSHSVAEPELARLLRFMALLKGALALVALAACYWRLGRPAAVWRELVYVGGPGAMAAGALCLWNVHSAGLAALGLHAGLFAVLAAALTDEAFIPPLRQRA